MTLLVSVFAIIEMIIVVRLYISSQFLPVSCKPTAKMDWVILISNTPSRTIIFIVFWNSISQISHMNRKNRPTWISVIGIWISYISLGKIFSAFDWLFASGPPLWLGQFSSLEICIQRNSTWVGCIERRAQKEIYLYKKGVALCFVVASCEEKRALFFAHFFHFFFRESFFWKVFLSFALRFRTFFLNKIRGHFLCTFYFLKGVIFLCLSPTLFFLKVPFFSEGRCIKAPFFRPSSFFLFALSI